MFGNQMSGTQMFGAGGTAQMTSTQMSASSGGANIMQNRTSGTSEISGGYEQSGLANRISGTSGG